MNTRNISHNVSKTSSPVGSPLTVSTVSPNLFEDFKDRSTSPTKARNGSPILLHKKSNISRPVNASVSLSKHLVSGIERSKSVTIKQNSRESHSRVVLSVTGVNTSLSPRHSVSPPLNTRREKKKENPEQQTPPFPFRRTQSVNGQRIVYNHSSTSLSPLFMIPKSKWSEDSPLTPRSTRLQRSQSLSGNSFSSARMKSRFPIYSDEESDDSPPSNLGYQGLLYSSPTDEEREIVGAGRPPSRKSISTPKSRYSPISSFLKPTSWMEYSSGSDGDSQHIISPPKGALSLFFDSNPSSPIDLGSPCSPGAHYRSSMKPFFEHSQIRSELVSNNQRVTSRPSSKMSDRSPSVVYGITERFSDYYPKMQQLLKDNIYDGDLHSWEQKYERLLTRYKSIPIGSSIPLSDIHQLQERLKMMKTDEQREQLEILRSEKEIPVTTQNLLFALGILLVNNKHDKKSLLYLQKIMLQNIRLKLIRFSQPPANARNKQTVHELQKYLDDWRFTPDRMEKHGGAIVGTLTMFVCVQFKILKHMLPKFELQSQLCKFENFLHAYRKLASQHQSGVT